MRVFPRPGMFAIPPSGCGAYSLLDAFRRDYHDKPPQFAYPPFVLMQYPFFDADWRYLDDPKTPPRDIFDHMKRIRLGDDWLFATGGQAWFRYLNETNSRLTGTHNEYHQVRTRIYGDLWYQDRLRLYVEGIYAGTYGLDLPPLITDLNEFDFLDLFIDAKLGTLAGEPVYARIGRQEFLFGSQRLITPLEWANTRRAFDGARVFRASEKLDIDFFWAQPVIPNRRDIDSVDNNVNFAGAWLTRKPKKGTFLDLYYLMLDNTNAITLQGITRAPVTVHTIGSRFAGDSENRFLWDFEAAIQLGRQGAQDIVAGMATAGVGYHAQQAWNPTAWVYYDYASGDGSPNVGDYNTFNSLFPFGHYYLGWADVIGRQNIHDVSASLLVYPAKWLTAWIQFHNFWLVQARDALYGPAGLPLRRDPSGQSGTFVGNELDLIFNFHLTRRTDFLVSYSYLWAGGYLNKTQPPGTGNADVTALYMLMNVRW